MRRGDSISALNCINYEVLTCEPMANLTTLTILLLQQLPKVLAQVELGAEVSELCSVALGVYGTRSHTMRPVMLAIWPANRRIR